MPEEKVKPEYEVEILSRADIVTYPRLTEPVPTRRITFYHWPYPPQTVDIPIEEWSLEEERKRIRKAIEELRKAKAEVYKV